MNFQTQSVYSSHQKTKEIGVSSLSDWSKFAAYRHNKEKFDPKILEPFDKVLIRSYNSTCWGVQLFSYIIEDDKDYPYLYTNGSHRYCIPYNDDTKHLLCTINEAPEYYKYWED